MNEAIIHDLGYKRYVGTRRPQSTRWQVVMRQQIAFAWKKWWRVKLWIGMSVLTTVIIGSILVFTTSTEIGGMSRAGGGGGILRIDEIVFRWSIEGLTKSSFFLAFTVGCGIIASDLKTGAFNFYFVRPVRPVDYVLGKLVGVFLLQAMVFLAPMLLLACVRVGLSHDSSEVVENLQFLPKALVVGGLGSLTYASLSLGFSAMFDKPWLNMLLWGVFYLFVSGIFVGIAMGTKTPWIGVVDVKYALMCLSFGLYHATLDIKGMPEFADWEAGAIGLCLLSAIGIAVAYLRVSTAAHRGIGGS